MDALLQSLLAATRQHKGSDLHIKAGAAPKLRMNGSLANLEMEPPTGDQVSAMLRSVMSIAGFAAFEISGEADFAVIGDGIGRFRVNAFRSRGAPALVARAVAGEPVPLAALGLPSVLGDLALKPRGLVLVTGPTGSGKTTTLASMINVINETKPVHIVTVEDPIEVMHRDKVASVSQRELGIDTMTWEAALRAAMRQDPDVVLIGEMRDKATVHAALEAAETGHLVMSTLHTSTVSDTITRILDFYPATEKDSVRAALAAVTQGIVCQRLVPRASGQGRVVAQEIAIGTGTILAAIADPAKTTGIAEICEAGRQYGMQAFDQHLAQLVGTGDITIADAMAVASNRDDFSVRLRRNGISSAAA